MSNSPEVAAAGSEKSPDLSLTEAQLSTFWAGVVANGDAARRMAGKVVPRQDVEDVVSTASILFLESFQRSKNPARFPTEEEEFRRRFLAIVRNHALDCVRDSDASSGRPIHSHWGVETEPSVRGRKTADRPLDHVFARNDMGDYDAPAADEAREKDNVDALDQILRVQVGKLPRMQRKVVVETFFDRRKRAEVAARHGISVKTYDNHLQAAFRTLRDELWVDAFDAIDVDRSSWYDRIEALSDRYDAALGQRIAREWLEAAAREGEASRPEGEGDKKSSAGAA